MRLGGSCLLSCWFTSAVLLACLLACLLGRCIEIITESLSDSLSDSLSENQYSVEMKFEQESVSFFCEARSSFNTRYSRRGSVCVNYCVSHAKVHSYIDDGGLSSTEWMAGW